MAQHTSSSLSSAFSQHGASDEESPVKSGTLLIAGCIDFEHATAKAPEGLPSHTVIDCGAPVRRTFSSSSALHFFVQLEDNRILAMGINANGQLGLNDTSNRTFPMPVRMPVSAEVVKIACGRFHSLFLFSNGEVYGCGANKVGQLGVGEGKVASADFKSLVKVPIRDVVDIDAGYEFSIACDKNGRYYSAYSIFIDQLILVFCFNNST